MKVVPPLLKMRAQISDDGRVARFFLLFNGGLNSAFAVPFHKAGLFLRAVRNTVATMATRLAANEADTAAEISEGLAEALSIKAVASGRNDAGERLLWIETVESGAFAFRLSHEAVEMLMETVCQNGGGSYPPRREDTQVR
jgi:hypothetical protein